MALSSQRKRAKKENQQLYFDLICGLISSIIAITAIIYVGLTQQIRSIGMYVTGLSFWIFYLCFSIFMICLGIYLWYKEKHWDEEMSRKDLKPPIIG
jgi:hypothetical protein